jgi:hypothetical protein
LSTLATTTSLMSAQLTAMGFTQQQATAALRSTNNDVEAAVMLLLANPSGEITATTSEQPPAPSSSAFDAEMDAAIKASMQTSKKESGQRQKANAAAYKSPPAPVPPVPRPTAANVAKKSNRPASVTKAFEAAQIRSSGEPKTNNTNNNPHNLKLPSDLKTKPISEQLTRLSLRFASQSLAVDTLHKTLDTILLNFGVERYRTVDCGSAGFRRAFEGVPGAHDFLLACGFVQQRGGSSAASQQPLLTLPKSTDPMNLSLGLSILAELKTSHWEYNLDRQLRLFDKEVVKAMGHSPGATNKEMEEEDLRRSQFLRLTPSDPGGMNCCKMTIQFGSGKSSIAAATPAGGGSQPAAVVGGSRNFSADDTLQDVLSWIGGVHGSKVYDKIVSGEWAFVNMDKKEGDEGRNLNLSKECRGWTLMRLEFWPSGRLGVRAAREM